VDTSCIKRSLGRKKKKIIRKKKKYTAELAAMFESNSCKMNQVVPLIVVMRNYASFKKEKENKTIFVLVLPKKKD
jgi:ribosomal protein S4E